MVLKDEAETVTHYCIGCDYCLDYGNMIYDCLTDDGVCINDKDILPDLVDVLVEYVPLLKKKRKIRRK